MSSILTPGYTAHYTVLTPPCNSTISNIKRRLALLLVNLFLISSFGFGQMLAKPQQTGILTHFDPNYMLLGIKTQQHVVDKEVHLLNDWNTIQTGIFANMNGSSNVEFALDAMEPVKTFVLAASPPGGAADIDQLRNGGIGEVPTPDNWVNGNAGPENSHFIESWSIPYRMRITGLTNNTSHNIIIEWDIMGSSGTKHAIDYITHFQNLGSNSLHMSLFGHNAEVVNPGFGQVVSGAANTFEIPAPSSAGSPKPGQPTNSFNSLDLKNFTIYNGTITSMSYVSQGDLNTDGSKTRLSINFTANFSGGANTVILGWGGHIASQVDWGIGESASDINGSPYHTRLIELDGSGGNQDRSLKADAVVVPPECIINSPDLCPLTTSSTATASLTNAAGVTTSYVWSLVGANTAGATLTGTTSGSIGAGLTAIPQVGISAPAGGFAAGTSFTVQLAVSRSFSGVAFNSTCTKTVNITTGATATATANPTSIDIRTVAHNTTLNVSVSPGNINDYDLSWSTPNGQGQLSSTTAVSPVYTAAVADQGQTIIFNVTLTPKAGTSGLCPNNASVEVPVNATSTCSVTCLTNCSPCAGTTSTFRGPTLTVPPNVPDPNTFYSWAITSGDATINGPANGETVSVTAGQTNYRLEVTITYTNPALNQAPCGIDVTVGKVTASDGHTNVSCFGGSNGSVTVTFSGGTAPYEVNFNGGGFAAQTSPKQYTGLTAGTYTWVVRDALGCEASGSETITQPDELLASDGHTNVSCFGGSNGSVTVTFSGGTAPYEVNFNGGGFAAQTSPKQYTGLTAGTYTWVVKDANGCEKSGSETITQPDELLASDGHTNVSCFGGSNGSVTVTFSGGTAPYEVNFNGGGFAAQTSPKQYTGLTAGTYTWVVKDANGCEKSGSETITQPDELLASDGHTNASCSGGNDGSVTVTFSGGTAPYEVNFNGGGFAAQTSPKQYSGLTAGTYTWVVKDANGCEKSGSETVEQPGSVTASDDHTNVSCFGGSNGSVTVTFSGGTAPYEVNFNGGGFAAQTSPKQYTGLTAGTYTWVVKDANGCQFSGSETVEQPTELLASDGHTNVSCFGGSNGSVTVTFSGGTAPYEVNFNGGGFAAQTSPKQYTGLTAGTYTWVVKDANGCEKSGSETITQPDELLASDGHTNVSCFGGSNGSVTVTFSGGTAPYEVNFNGGGFAAQTSPKQYTGLTAGTYTWVVKDANGCEKSGSETITQPDELLASDGHTNVSCYGGNDGSVTVTFSGGTAPYEVNFNGGGFAAQTSPKQYTGLTAGTYTWVVKDANGCEKSGSETITQPDELLASDGHTNVSCFGGSNGSVTVTFSGGTAPYEVNFNGGGFATQASPKQYTGLTAGTYTWVVKDANGCEKSGSETITQPDAITCNLTTPSIPSCGASGTTVSGTVSGGTGPYTCSASFDAAGVNAGWTVTNCAVVGGAITVTYTSGGVANTVLTVTVTDANNCTSTCTVTLTCDGGKGCTPGFWKTHPEVWDNCNDLVVQAIPGAACSGTGTSGNFTPGADFTTSTPFVAYFGITNNGCGGGCRISNLPTTMGAAMAAGGGDCKKLARTGVAALLNAAVFGSDYLDATGFATYADLYNAIKNGFNTCTYEPLATNLDRANNQDHSLCSGLPATILTSSIVSGRIDNTLPTVTFSKELTVQAYPNPFNSEINFRFVSPVSGYANLEVYDMVGRKLAIVYSGSVDANVPRTATYRVPATQHVPMVYRLNVDGKSVTGKLLPGDKNSYQPKPKP